MEYSENAAASGPHSTTRTIAGPNLAAWVLVLAFVGLVLSVAVPAMTNGADMTVGLVFMVGLAAALLGSVLALSAAAAKGWAVLGALILLAGIVLLYGLVPSLAALGVVLLGVAIQIGSLPEAED